MSNHVNVHLDARSTVKHHVSHGDGYVSLRIEHPDERSLSSYYLCGSLDELVRFADRITDEVERLRGQANVADLLAEAERRKQAESRVEAVQ